MSRFTHHAVVGLALAALTLTACEPKADTANPNSYVRDGLTFRYPGNWEITEDSVEDGVRTLFIETSGDAIISIQIFAEAEALPLREYAKLFSQTTSEQMPVGEISTGALHEKTRQTPGGARDVLNEAVDVTILGERVPHTRDYYQFEGQGRVGFLATQVAVEDLGAVGEGFKLVLGSIALQ